MSASTPLMMPSLLSRPRTVLPSVLDGCLVTCVLTTPVPVLLLVRVAVSAAVSAVVVVAAVEEEEDSVDVVEDEDVAVTVAVEASAVVVVVAVAALRPEEVLPASPVPRSRSTKRGSYKLRTEGFGRVYHYSGLCGLSFQNKLGSIWSCGL